MISLAEVPCTEDRSGQLWDLSDFFRGLASEITIRTSWAKPQSKSTQTSRHYLPNSSRSYCDRYVAEVHANVRCGIDLELLDAQNPNWSIDSKLFERAMLAPGELELIKSCWVGTQECLPTIIWSSKEALAKALGNAQNYSPTQLLSPITWCADRIPNWIAQHLEILTEDDRRLILWVVAEKL